MRGLQLIEFLLSVVLVFQVELQTTISQRQCNRLTISFPSCNSNSVLRVTKSTEMYQVTLLATEWQCLNDFCLANDQNHRQRNIRCNETCRASQQLNPQLGNVKNIEIHVLWLCMHAMLGIYVALSFVQSWLVHACILRHDTGLGCLNPPRIMQ